MNNNIKKILHNKRLTFQGFSFVSQSTSSSKAFPFPKTNGHNYYGGESNPYWQWRAVSMKWNQYLSLAAIITCSLQFISPAQSEQSQEKERNDVYDNLLSELKAQLKPDQIEVDIEECKLRAKPWNSYHRLDTFPRAIIFPETTEDVSFIVKTCNRYRVPIIPFGGGTSIEGQTLVILLHIYAR